MAKKWDERRRPIKGALKKNQKPKKKDRGKK
jgi:hypothetical protein